MGNSKALFLTILSCHQKQHKQLKVTRETKHLEVQTYSTKDLEGQTYQLDLQNHKWRDMIANK